MFKKISTVILLIILALGVSKIAFSDNRKKDNDPLYKQIELFSNTLAIIQKEYVTDTKQKDLIYGSLKGMLASLDPHSQFMDPDTYNELKADTKGKFGGLGIEITVKDGLLTVITPIEGTPAWNAGIKAGDRIIKINDLLTRELSLTDAVKKMRGKPGEAINLTIFRDSENKLLELKIIRDIIKIEDIKHARILEEEIGYIRLVEFRENTLAEFNKALDYLTKKNMKALIIDLRNNPGGLLDVAVKVTGRFIAADKMIVHTKSRHKSQDLEFYSQEKNSIPDLPLAILINEGSASGSEIMAGALQDYKRAIIIGVKSFGKGSVQTVIPLGDGSALRLTTSHYFTPSGKIINGKGVTPDIVIEEKTEQLDAKNSGTEIKKPGELFKEIERRQSKVKTEEAFNYQDDAQLMRALNTLKAILIYKQSKP